MGRGVGLASVICAAMACLFAVSSVVLVLLLITRHRTQSRSTESEGQAPDETG